MTEFDTTPGVLGYIKDVPQASVLMGWKSVTAQPCKHVYMCVQTCVFAFIPFNPFF